MDDEWVDRWMDDELGNRYLNIFRHLCSQIFIARHVTLRGEEAIAQNLV